MLTWFAGTLYRKIIWNSLQWRPNWRDGVSITRACFLSLAWSKLRLCSANHRPGYWSNLPCDWPSTAWAYSEQEAENGHSGTDQRKHQTSTSLASVRGIHRWPVNSQLPVTRKIFPFDDVIMCSPVFQFTVCRGLFIYKYVCPSSSVYAS